MTQVVGLQMDKLKRYEARTWVQDQSDLSQLETIEKYCQELLGEHNASAEDLEVWIRKRSELEACIDQISSQLYIEMTCETEDPDKAKAYQDYIQNIAPQLSRLNDQLNAKFLNDVDQLHYENKGFEIYIKAIRTDKKLFRDENVELGTKVQLLSQEYQKICGAMMVEFDGQEQTMPQMGKYLQETDRDLRERAWRAISQRRLEDKDQLNDIFNRMLKLRHQMALNAGFDNYCDYQFERYHRFDYTPQDCLTYHETMEQTALPLWKEIIQRRAEEMNLDVLRPWDIAVDPKGREPLKPFKHVDDLVRGCQNIFNKVDSELATYFKDMSDLNLLDLASRKGKAPGGYQSALNEVRKPFIFMNAVGVDGDVRTLLHEGGHAFHTYACASQPLLDYRHAPMEFCEVASMSMELLGGEYLNEFYNEKDFKRSIQSHLEDTVFVLIWVATIDAFQYWIYQHPQQTTEERTQAWLDIRRRYAVDQINWDGLEEEHCHAWQKQLHIYEVPFYYIEYGIAQLGALQLWLNAKQDWPEALQQYKDALALGGSKPLPELFSTAGLNFDFSETTVKPLIEIIRETLKKL